MAHLPFLPFSGLSPFSFHGDQRLDVSRNTLLELPVSFKAMTALQELVLSFNRISELPEIGGAELRVLLASHNHLNQLPFFLSNRTNLEELDLSHNYFIGDRGTNGDLFNSKTDLFKSTLVLSLKQLRTLEMDPQNDRDNDIL
eukprot:scaffold23478_cov107-Cylindrotheca_fusiformis.AAC.1